MFIAIIKLELNRILFNFHKSNYNLESVENDATLEYKKFVCTDFLISTNSATLGFITQSGTKVDVKFMNHFEINLVRNK